MSNFFLSNHSWKFQKGDPKKFKDSLYKLKNGYNHNGRSRRDEDLVKELKPFTSTLVIDDKFNEVKFVEKYFATYSVGVKRTMFILYKFVKAIENDRIYMIEERKGW